jgi:alkanesulfonate monooxygenase SsuD/methylene tetrahydromethanopterin reductase-like flavin-dependent oxidoreductase (luciferase family)
MKFGFVMNYDEVFNIARFSSEAEDAGWDGLFLSHCMWAADTFVSLTVAAMHTKHIRLGTMLTPVSCIRPWKLASEVATLDNFSNGRVILTIGMGATDTGFSNYGEATDLRTRAELVDEAIDIMTNLWSGKSFSHNGTRYSVTVTDDDIFKIPAPVQQPRPPIWVVGVWPRPKSMRRVLRCDGLVPSPAESPEDVAAAKAWVEARRNSMTGFDIIIEGATSIDSSEARDQVQPWADAGATWWMESMWGTPDSEDWWKRMRQGPPDLGSQVHQRVA